MDSFDFKNGKYAEGYDFDTMEEVPNDYYCPICFKLMRNVKQMECGHVLCEGCLQRHADTLRERNEVFFCPVDRKQIDLKKVTSVPFIDRLISISKVQCPNECGWIGDLGNLKDHSEKCQVCEEICPNEGCNEFMLPSKIDDHMKKCKYNKVSCPYSNFGCQVKLITLDVEDHLENNTDSHLKLVESSYEQLQCQYARISSDLAGSRILVTQLVQENQTLQESRDISETLVAKLHDTNKENGNLVTQLVEDNHSLQDKLKTNTDNFTKEKENYLKSIKKLKEYMWILGILSFLTLISKGFFILTILFFLYLRKQ